MVLPDIETLYKGYGAYHHNPMFIYYFILYLFDLINDKSNKIIHIIFIPIILLSLISILFHFQLNINGFKFPIILIIIQQIVYIRIDLEIGFISTLVYFPLAILTNFYYEMCIQNFDQNFHFQLMVSLQIIAWLAQFFGHGYFEKNTPALLDNLLYIFAAPIFVVLEILFILGFYQNLNIKCEKGIQEQILAMQAKKQNKKK